MIGPKKSLIEWLDAEADRLDRTATDGDCDIVRANVAWCRGRAAEIRRAIEALETAPSWDPDGRVPS